MFDRDIMRGRILAMSPAEREQYRAFAVRTADEIGGDTERAQSGRDRCFAMIDLIDEVNGDA
jgi:hypothetical protein